MYAVFAGKKISDGFSLIAIINDQNEAEDLAIAKIVDGQFAEAVKIQTKKNYEIDPNGKFIDVSSFGIGDGFEVFGPFIDERSALNFGEYELDDNEWTIFEVQTA